MNAHLGCVSYWLFRW